MLAKHDGHTWNVSAVRGKYVYLRTMRGATRINDCLVEVLLNGWGDPMIHGQETARAKCAYCKSLLQPGDEVKSTLLLLRGNMLSREERQYCSRQCAEHGPDGARAITQKPAEAGLTSGNTDQSIPEFFT